MHTETPWTLDEEIRPVVSEGVHVLAPDGSTIAVVLGGNSEECKANAKVIAASAAMLDHLVWVQKSLNEGEDPDLIIAETALLIEKAKGEL